METLTRKLKQIRVSELKKEIATLSLEISGKNREYAQDKTKTCLAELMDLEDELWKAAQEDEIKRLSEVIIDLSIKIAVLGRKRDILDTEMSTAMSEKHKLEAEIIEL